MMTPVELEQAIESTTQEIDDSPAMDPGQASIEQSIEFIQGIREWCDDRVEALNGDLDRQGDR